MNIAIIGSSGHFGYPLDGVSARPGAHLIAIAPGTPGEDMSPLVGACAARGLTPRVYDDYRALLASERIDLAAVNPWIGDIAAASIACLERGVHVYSEKPLATEPDALCALERAWRASGCALGGMFSLRTAPWFVALSSVVQSGGIGPVRLITARKSYKLGQRGPMYRARAAYGGTIPWVAIHAIDWVLALGGRCTRVAALQSSAVNRDHDELETTASVLLALEGGVMATVTADYLRPNGSARHDDDRLMVVGAHGTIEAVDGQVYLTNDSPRRALPLGPAQSPFWDFADTIGTPEAENRALDALRASRVALAARDAGDAGRWINIGEGTP